MTGRIRSIKPELLEDEKTSTLSDSEFRIFVSAILMADDYGNFRGSWSFVAGQAFHSAPDEPGREAGFERLIAIGLLDRYRVRGQVYLHIHGWERHQRVDKPGKARCPGPSEADQCNPRSRDSRETLATDLRSGSPDPTSESDPERDLRAHTDRPPVAPEPTPPEALHRSLEPSAPPSPRREPTDAPWGQPGDFGAKVAGEATPARRPEPTSFDGFDDDLLHPDDAGAREAIALYNEHRHPALPEWSTKRGSPLPPGLIATMRDDAAREREVGVGAVEPWPMHRRSGWIAFAKATHGAMKLHQWRWDLAMFFTDANKGARESKGLGFRMRLFGGGYAHDFDERAPKVSPAVLAAEQTASAARVIRERQSAPAPEKKCVPPPSREALGAMANRLRTRELDAGLSAKVSDDGSTNATA